MQGDDGELTAAVRAAQDGDEAAFRTVYRSVHPRLLGYVRTLVGESDAEDVTSESWLQIARDLGRFSGDADRFRGWAARIARNRALDHIRMRGRRPAIGGDETELAERPADADTAREALESLGTGHTLALIAQLPRDQAEAVVLRVVVGLDAKSAAGVLGKRPGAVRTSAHRGLRRLADLIEGPPGEPVDQGGAGPLGPTGPGSPGSAGGGAGPPPGSGRMETMAAREPAPLPRRGAASAVRPGASALTGRESTPAEVGADATGEPIPSQRLGRSGATTSASVTDSCARTQRDM
ncbi:RNA polymerase sigma factor [Streptomyces sp. AC563]|uniref:RNA polymerase sigma factor n=1 Tax=Streptomyces buecherae TaxID=2763006 RepID=UPI00164E9ABD|nr:RNA polymerase sigma factor [Streptomyces buecherae]MBC3988984.1 RNA polymerase sigma factor [Streptomyces buecherae]